MPHRLGRCFGAVVASLCAATAFTIVPASPAGAATKTFSVANCASRVSATHGAGCGEALSHAVRWLNPGDVLKIAPGTYDVGKLGLAPYNDGPNRSRITITAQDASRPPLIRGDVRLHKPYNVTLSRLRFQATVSGASALGILCGTGWRLERSHVFGASKTRAFSNLTIAGDRAQCPDEPRGFTVANNVFNQPYTNPNLQDHPDPDIRVTAVAYHNVYTTFEGSPATSGVIERNLFIGNRNGSGVKLGSAGDRGPWNVKVRFNTFYDGAYAVLLAYDVRNNALNGNLVVDMRGGPASADGAAVAVSELRDTSNTIAHTYGHEIKKVWADIKTGSRLTVGPDNAIRPSPRFWGYLLHPTYDPAKPYGRYGDGSF